MEIAYCSEFHSEMITDCEAMLKDNTFLIMVLLTEKGLKNVKSVSNSDHIPHCSESRSTFFFASLELTRLLSPNSFYFTFTQTYQNLSYLQKFGDRVFLTR